LTRFQKEQIISNSSTQQFYEIPKIYVHSPKAKGRILKIDESSNEKPLRILSTVNSQQQQDYIREADLKTVQYA
jgi:hypothetical protein